MTPKPLVRLADSKSVSVLAIAILFSLTVFAQLSTMGRLLSVPEAESLIDLTNGTENAVTQGTVIRVSMTD